MKLKFSIFFHRLDLCLKKLAKNLSSLGWMKLLVVLEPLGLLIAAISVSASAALYIIKTPEREEEQLVRLLTLRQSSGQILNQSIGKKDEVGQTVAIETLHSFGDSFSDRNFQGTRFSEVKLQGVNFSFSNLSNTSFFGATLSNSFFDRTDLSYARLDRADLRGSWLPKANLCNSSLSNSNMSGAKLLEANLNGADLSKANMSGANISGASFEDAFLNGTDLRGVYGLTQSQLDNACIYEHLMVWTYPEDDPRGGIARANSSPPILPQGFNPPPFCIPYMFPEVDGKRHHKEVECSTPTKTSPPVTK